MHKFPKVEEYWAMAFNRSRIKIFHMIDPDDDSISSVQTVTIKDNKESKILKIHIFTPFIALRSCNQGCNDFKLIERICFKI